MRAIGYMYLSARAIAWLHLIEPRASSAGIADDASVDSADNLQLFRHFFDGRVITAGGYVPESGAAIVAVGLADAVAFGRLFIANPDLPARIRTGSALNAFDRTTSYGGGAHGYASVRRRDGLPQDLFADYWRDVHATLCSRLPGLGFYVQQHFDRDHHANLWPVAEGVRRITAILDGSAELGFATLEKQARFGEESPILYADERNLFSEAVAYMLPAGSITLVDREEDGIRNGPDRLHRVHVYMNRIAGTDASRWLEDASASLAADAAVQKWKLHLPEPYDNAHPAPPSPDVGHHVEADRLNLAVAEVAFENARTAAEFFTGGCFQKMMRRQARHLDAIGAYRVTGFYTFVRDGRPTTAGLRGSRPAELIDAIGAANQLAPAIVDRFAPKYYSRPTSPSS